MTLRPGLRLGPYEIQSAIGAGGMGEVYKARDTRLERVVAIKILPAALAADPQFRERFDREARAISQLEHPHICALYDVGEQDGTAYLVMQHLEGETLARRLERGALPLHDALTIAIEIASALDAAHRSGIVHRDLKPGNVMLTKSGAKLLDFGLAKTGVTTAAGGASMLPTTPPELTAAGAILGTFQYMAPEQLEGKDADARSDIFAFGALVYEMATGRKAFEGKSQASLIAAILDRDPPPIGTLQPLAPHALERVVRHCLAKVPDDRWQSAHDLVTELKWIAEGVSESVSTVSRPAQRRREIFTGLAGLVVGALSAAVATLLIGRGSSIARPVHLAIPFDTTATVSLPNNRSPLAISPDGQHIVLSAARNGVNQLYLRSIYESNINGIPGTEGGEGPFFSPDGRSLAFFANGRLKRVEISGGGSTDIASAQNVRGGWWGPDGFIVFTATTAAGLSRVASGGGNVETLTTVNEHQKEKSHRYPQVLPGGKAVLFTIALNDILSFDDALIGVVSLETKQAKIVARGGTYARYVSTGHLLYARGGTLFAVPFDLRQLAVSGAAVPVVDRFSMSTQGGTAAFDVSGNGTLAYIPAPATIRRDRVLAVERGGQSDVLVDTDMYLETVAASPDGSRLALYVAGANDSIWLCDLARKATTRLSFGRGDATYPRWTPDGRNVTYGTSVPKGLASTAVDGSGKEETLLTSERSGTRPGDWSPDGRLLVFEDSDPRTGGTGLDLWIWSTNDRTRRPFLQTPSDESSAKFSPDGRWMAYTSNESGHDEVCVRPFPGPGGKWQVSTDGGTTPLWSRDGHEIFYRRGTAVMAVPVSTVNTFSGGVPRRLFDGPYLAGYSVMPDGKRFVMIERQQPGIPQHVNLVLNWFVDLQKRMAAQR